MILSKSEDANDLLASPENRAFYEARFAYWSERLKPMTDAIRRSQRITGEDLNIRVGPCVERTSITKAEG